MTEQTFVPERVLELASRGSGMHSSDLPDVKSSHVSNAVARLTKKGLLYRVIYHRRHVRYFTNPAAASMARERVCARERAKPEIKLQDLGRASWTVNEPAILPPHIVVQYGPSHPPRFREYVLPFVHGGLRGA